MQCVTTAGKSELTRVAVVNEQRQCVYESLVKPRNKITNYLTQYVTFLSFSFSLSASRVIWPIRMELHENTESNCYVISDFCFFFLEENCS